MQQIPLGIRLPGHAVFDTFFAGANAAAVRHLQALASGREEPAALLRGASATGKTHLLQALCAGTTAAGRRAGYLAVGTDEVQPEILDGWEQLDIVCLDALNRISGDAGWERAIFALYQRMQERGGTLVTAARVPDDTAIARLPDLESRLRSGPVFLLQALDDNEMLQALQLRASHRGFELPDDSGRFLLRHCRRDMHTLCALLDRLDDASLAAQRRLTIPFVRNYVDRHERG